MKNEHRCPKCGSTHGGYFDTVMDDIGAIEAVPRKLADARASGTWNLGPSAKAKAEVEAYVCTQCGYFEEYVKDAQNVDWEAIENFHWLDQ